MDPWDPKVNNTILRTDPNGSYNGDVESATFAVTNPAQNLRQPLGTIPQLGFRPPTDRFGLRFVQAEGQINGPVIEILRLVWAAVFVQMDFVTVEVISERLLMDAR